jgi:2-dehydro-3-deoxyphosphogalactonate aldolase
MPLIAILRGLTPAHAVEVGTALYESGIRVIEVPLNSPQPFASIAALAHLAECGCLIGAGTVLSIEHVRHTHQAGGRLVVSPNCNAGVIAAALDLGLQVMPGIATATDAFSAIEAGARRLKLFPAATYGPKHLQALGAVLPAGVGVYPVGGIGAEDIPVWLAAGASGFGFGSELFRPSYSLTEIARRAAHLVAKFIDARRAAGQS